MDKGKKFFGKMDGYDIDICKRQQEQINQQNFTSVSCIEGTQEFGFFCEGEL